jgi:DNA repair protein RecN (Recombination protein N)
MLEKLVVRNFAIIEDISINFKDGMTVLTGQTGAGKSLLIDSISLLLGSRADTDMIRYGAKEAYICGEFKYSNPKINEILNELGINVSNTLKIERTIGEKKSTIKINDTTTNLTILNRITINLADISSQQETFRLLNKDNYLSFIDSKTDTKLNSLLNDYVIKREEYLDNYQELKEIEQKSKSSKDNLDYLESAYNELSCLDLYKGLDKEIEEKILKLKNFDKIYSNLKEAYERMCNEYFNIDAIYDSYESVKSVVKYDESLKEICDNLDTSYSLASNSIETIKKILSNMEYNPDEFDELNKRQNEINNMCLKYHKDFDKLVDYVQELKFEIDLVSNYDELLDKTNKKLKNSFDILTRASKELTSYRKDLALKLSDEIVKECEELELPNTKFLVSFEDIDYSNYLNKDIFKDNGTDIIDFMVSLNLGEPLKPLSKVASGGEMSRIMLSFKAHYAKINQLSLMVFDEIDTGVSGHVAKEIAKKMKDITKYNQVLAITHLPQVAAYADNQLFIYKEELDGRTITHVKELDNKERIIEIAKMLSGETVSKYALETAKEMLEDK